MSAENPYAAPVADPVNPEALQRRAFPEMDTKRLKQLRNDSHSIRTLAVLLVIGIVAVLAILIFALSGDRSTLGVAFPELTIQAVILGVNLATVIGLFKRAIWGRVMGFITCGIMLIGFPIGTLIGVLCLIALARGGVLFGPDRLNHKELEAEWKYRKKAKIA